MKKIVIQPEYSAVAANTKKLSRPVRAAIEALKRRGVKSVCEVGCGLLANTPHLLRAFPSVVLTDSHAQYERTKDDLVALSKQFRSLVRFVDAESFETMALDLDAVIIINVLHVLPSPEERVACLQAARRNLRANGFAFVDVPHKVTYYQTPPRNSFPYHDGRAIPRGDHFTFYKDISIDELLTYTSRAGFVFDEKVALDHRNSVVCRKT